jgi:predicted permease
MGIFLIALSTVALMLAYALPGFLFVKTKLISPDQTVVFSKLLLFVCQPALVIYSAQQLIKTLNSGAVNASFMYKNIAICAAFAVILMLAFVLGSFALLKRRYDDVRFRIYTLATVFANVGFFGMPVIESILKSHPEAVVYSSVFSIIMNIMAWTVASAIITQDKKYISIKKAILNPAALVLVFVIPLMIFKTELPAQINNAFTLLGKFSTPLCMIIMGMRLATVKWSELLGVKAQYVTAVVKNFVVPLISFGILLILPIDITLKKTIFILTCCPIANICINFAELLGRGQKTAANLVLISTLSSIITVPLILTLVKFF